MIERRDCTTDYNQTHALISPPVRYVRANNRMAYGMAYGMAFGMEYGLSLFQTQNETKFAITLNSNPEIYIHWTLNFHYTFV